MDGKQTRIPPKTRALILNVLVNEHSLTVDEYVLRLLWNARARERERERERESSCTRTFRVSALVFGGIVVNCSLLSVH